MLVTERRYEQEPSSIHAIASDLDIAPLPLAKDIDDLAFKDLPKNEALARNLDGGALLA